MARPEEAATFAALKVFAETVTAKMNTLIEGEPEDQLRAPFETFMQDVGRGLAQKVICTGETSPNYSSPPSG